MNAFVSVGATPKQPLLLKGARILVATDDAQRPLGRPSTDAYGGVSSAMDMLRLSQDAKAIADSLGVLEAADAGIQRIQSLTIEAIGILECARRSAGAKLGVGNIKSRAIRNDSIPVTEHNLLGTGTAAVGVVSNSACTAAPISESTLVSSLLPAIVAGDALTVNGRTISFRAGTGNKISAAGAVLDVETATVRETLDAIEAISGGQAFIDSAGHIRLASTGWAQMTLVGSVLAKLRFAPDDHTPVKAAPIGHTLKIGIAGDDAPVIIVFGDARDGAIKTLAQLNAALAPRDLRATLDSSGRLTIATSGEGATDRIDWIAGTITTAGGAFEEAAAPPGTSFAQLQTVRSDLVTRYNAILAEIDGAVTASMSSGRNLLAGDDLSLASSETGKSMFAVAGIQASSAALGLSRISAADLSDPSFVNDLVKRLAAIVVMQRREALTFGSALLDLQSRHDLCARLVVLLGQGSFPQRGIGEEAANLEALRAKQAKVSSTTLKEAAKFGALRLLKRSDGYYR